MKCWVVDDADDDVFVDVCFGPDFSGPQCVFVYLDEVSARN